MMTIENTCYSIYEGCACHFEKGHEGLHECPECQDYRWTDEEAIAWIEELRKQYK